LPKMAPQPTSNIAPCVPPSPVVSFMYIRDTASGAVSRETRSSHFQWMANEVVNFRFTTLGPWAASAALIALLALPGLPKICTAQDANQSWSTTNQQESPSGAINPTRSRETHSEADGHAVDKTSL